MQSNPIYYICSHKSIFCKWLKKVPIQLYMAQRNYTNHRNKHANNYANRPNTKYNSLPNASDPAQTNLYHNVRMHFPKVELSYETRVHKKVPCDYAVAIPQGNKFYAWFTYYNNAHVCFMIQPGFASIQPVLTSFHPSLCFGEHGTLFYGTIVHYENTRFFSVEDVFFYKGTNVSKQLHIHKMQLFAQMRRTKELGAYALNSNFVTFGLPVVNASLEDLGNIVPTLPYKVFCIQMYVHGSKEKYSTRWAEFSGLPINTPASASSYGPIAPALPVTTPVKPQQVTNTYKQATRPNKIFWINADIQRDVYYLHEDKTDEMMSNQIAYIPNFETSRLLNSYFRSIKENERLDALEESDDEEEFENGEADKYVFLDRMLRMECAYNARFKKWVPIKLVKDS